MKPGQIFAANPSSTEVCCETPNFVHSNDSESAPKFRRLSFAVAPRALAKTTSPRCEAIFESKRTNLKLRSQFDSLPEQPLSAGRALDDFNSIEWHETQQVGAQAIENKTIIVNSTFGMLPYVHKAADLAVVIGPINFFEPLAVGTPTLIFRKSDSESRNSDFGHYDEKIYDALIETGLSTGLAESTGSINRIAPAIQKLVTRVSDPAFKPTPVAEAAIPGFLDALEKHVRYLLINGKTPKPGEQPSPN